MSRMAALQVLELLHRHTTSFCLLLHCRINCHTGEEQESTLLQVRAFLSVLECNFRLRHRCLSRSGNNVIKRVSVVSLYYLDEYHPS